MLEQAPSKPVLNIMVWLADQDGKPGFPRGVSIPQAMVQKWYQRMIFGQQFRDFYDEVIAKCGSPDSQHTSSASVCTHMCVYSHV